MNVSVLIPVYNAAGTIRATLDSVLCQTLQPDEILVMDDGSSDETPEILASYGGRITVFRQPNGGLSRARNALCARAGGSLIAFLDSDDVWHPKYLEAQWDMFCRYPDAVVLFAGHVNFYGNGPCQWPVECSDSDTAPEFISPLAFFERYNRHNGPFSSYSFCCVRRRVLTEIGSEPFREDGAEDFYCTALLSLLGPALYLSTPLAGYRVREGSLSSRRIAGLRARVRAFEILRGHFQQAASPKFAHTFKSVFASHRRQYAKYLLGARQTFEGRRELLRSLSTSAQPVSLAKSVGLLLLTYMPPQLQPKWPTSYER